MHYKDTLPDVGPRGGRGSRLRPPPNITISTADHDFKGERDARQLQAEVTGEDWSADIDGLDVD